MIWLIGKTPAVMPDIRYCEEGHRMEVEPGSVPRCKRCEEDQLSRWVREHVESRKYWNRDE